MPAGPSCCREDARAVSRLGGRGIALFSLAVVLAAMAVGQRFGTGTADRPLSETDFILSTLPGELAVGQAICLVVEPRVQGPFEYRWLYKHDEADWDWSAPWTTAATHVFRPTGVGAHSLHVDIRRRGRSEVEVGKWLGTIVVSGPLVENIFYTPAATALPAGVPIEFLLYRADQALEDLEFRLWDLLPEERVVRDWGPWPLPPFVCAEPRTTALQVDVRLKRLPQVIDRHWLSTFSFFGRQEPSAANLLRNLISDDFDVFGFPEAVAILARELWLATHMLQWRHEGVPPADARRRLEGLAGVESVETSPGGPLRVRMTGDRAYDIDLEACTLSQAGSPVLLRLTPDRYPHYRQALETMSGLARDVRIIGLLTLAVYEGYHYGTPPRFALADLPEAVSHCGSQIDLLRRILAACGLPAQLVFLTAYDEQQNTAAHGLVQTRLNDATPLLLDPTNGFLYLYDITDLGRRPIPEAIVLPQCRDLHQFDLRTLSARPIRVIVADAAVPNCVPLTPADGVVTTLPAPPAP